MHLYVVSFSPLSAIFLLDQYFSYIVVVVLLVEETGVPGKNDPPAASQWQTLSHNVVSSTHRHERGSNS
jgi:hypothetical protein